MNLKRLLILSATFMLSLIGCNKTPKQPSDSSQSEESVISEPGEESEESEPVSIEESESEETYDFDIVERNYTYENRLEEPSNIVHNVDELGELIDYHAFYKDVSSFDVTIADDYVYATRQQKAYNEGCYLYWSTELVNGVMGFAVNEKDENTWNITFKFYPNAVQDGHPTTTMLKDLSYVEPTSDRSEEYDDFATDDENKKIVDVASSQQLWYAAEHGYRINALEGSPAEYYYNKAKDLLRNIIEDDMTDYQKADTLYNYITHHASYCYEALDLPDGDDPVNYPDQYAAPHKSFYLDGFFDNGTVVCDGYAKTYPLLGRMEGLNILRGSGSSDYGWISKEVAGHAYCYVEIDGKYYLSCPTWGQQTIDYSSGKFIVSQTYFLNTRAHMDQYYRCLTFKEYDFATEVNYQDEFKSRYLIIDGNQYSTYIPFGRNTNPYIEYFKNTTEKGFFVELCFETANYASSFKESLPRGTSSMQTSDKTLVVFKR